MSEPLAAISQARFDAYAATFDARPGEVIDLLREFVPSFDFEALRSGKQSYRQAWKLTDGQDTALLLANSAQRPDEVHLTTQGAWSHGMAAFLRDIAPGHRVSRVDACLDFDQAGAFDRLHEQARALAAEHRVKTSLTGDWEGCEEGRTYYVGSPKSVARTRIYEKGQQLRRVDPQASPHLVRVETQVRPQKEGKALAAKISPADVLAGSIVSRELVAFITGTGLDPVAFGNQRKPPSPVGVRSSWMARQYGSLILRELLPMVGGSITDLGLLILAQCNDPENPRVLEQFMSKMD